MEEDAASSSGGFPEFGEGLFTGLLVEIARLPGKIRPLASTRVLERLLSQEEAPEEEEEEEEPAEIDPNGQAGQALYFFPEDLTYVVLTFDGVLLRVPEGNLRDYEEVPTEEGGFDLVWPNELVGQQNFAPRLAEIVHEKGYAVVQLWNSQKDREAVENLVNDIQEWHLPAKKYENAYLGWDNTTKYSFVKTLVDGEDDEESLDDDDDMEALQLYNRILSHAALALEPFADAFGCSFWGRMPGMFRVPLTSQEGDDLRPSTGADDEDEFIGHVNFLMRRTFLTLCTIDNSGGLLDLIPRADLEDNQVTIKLTKNKLIIINCQLLGYRYSPKGNFSTAIQTWIMKEPLNPDVEDPEIVDIPVQLQERRVHVMSSMVNYPGQALGPQAYWVLNSSGTDAQTKVPISRFDIDMYYAETGKDTTDACVSYACHGSFISDNGLLYFDNVKFRLSPGEVRMMSPTQRIVLETGYEALYRAKYNMETMHGMECGVFIGDSGSVWHDGSGQLNAFQGLGKSSAITSCRLSHCLGLFGPCSAVDTACSSSLVAVTLAHSCIRRRDQGQGTSTKSHVSNSMALGVTLMLTPRWYVLYCGPKMLSPRGRCFTFDTSADGFARGEGCGGLYFTASAMGYNDWETPTKDWDMLACLTGSAANQDGRSASMTAPHGPSQQQCIAASMKEYDLSPGEMSLAECHGTGTALGDPIEVSALRMVTQGRELPILTTSAKTIIGHLEAAAGLAGLIKCVLSVIYSSATPNCHFRSLNPHLDVNGYPAFFVDDITDLGTKASMSGVSSFGFGGTNARGDIWGRAQLGVRGTKVLLNPYSRLLYAKQNQRMMDENTMGPLDSDIMYASGTWDAHTGLTRLARGGYGEYSFYVVLGETRKEHFTIWLNGSMAEEFHPATSNADQRQDTRGPEPGYDKSTWWTIDGKADGFPTGTVYHVDFTWGFDWEFGEYKSVWWEAVVGSEKHLLDNVMSRYKHCYYIMGTWNSWAFQEMNSSKEEDGLWLVDIRIGVKGEEEFQFARDSDWRQVIYPAAPRARKTTIPIRGPDNLCEDKAWLVRGSQGEVVSIQLRILDGEITLTTSSAARGVKIWQSIEEDNSPAYCVVGSWNSWAFSPMSADPETYKSYKCRVRLGATGEEEFQILAKKDWEKRFYPNMPHAGIGEANMSGPDGLGQDDMTWLIQGEAWQQFDIFLDLNQTDPAWMVWWLSVSEAAEPLDAEAEDGGAPVEDGAEAEEEEEEE